MMICNKCGNTLQDTDVFCIQCGAKVECYKTTKLNKRICKNCNTEFDAEFEVCPNCGTISSAIEETSSNYETETTVNYTSQHVNQSTYANRPTVNSEYQQLGGWLAFFAYGHLFGAVCLIITTVVSLVSLIKIANVLSVYATYYGAGQTMSLIVPALIQMVANGYGIYCCIKVPQMIRDRNAEILKFYEIWGVVNISAFILMAIFGGAVYLLSIVGVLGCYALYEAYYRKSVRVRTYFGSDEYLQLSYITKIMDKYNISFGNKNGMVNSNAYTTNKYQRSNVSGKVCSACGAEMLESDMFCPKCGGKWEAKVPQEKPVDVKGFCMYCGAELLPGADFCIKCGKKK